MSWMGVHLPVAPGKEKRAREARARETPAVNVWALSLRIVKSKAPISELFLSWYLKPQ